MGSILITIFLFILLVICGLMTVIILMQKPSANAGMGAALGGGAAESVFGGETANVLLKYTVRISVVFFVLSFLLYMGILYYHRGQSAASSDVTLPNLGGTTTTAPAKVPAGTALAPLVPVATGTAASAPAAKPTTASAVPAASAASASASTPKN